MTSISAGSVQETKDPKAARAVPALEMHVAHACNLTCESCSHFSNGGHKGWLSVDHAAEMLAAWKYRLKPKVFNLLGGEPTLNPRLVDFVYMAKECWPDTQLLLTTNGFFLERHPTLPKALHDTQAAVAWTIHHHGPDYQQKARAIRQIWEKWVNEHPFTVRIEDSAKRWTRRHHGVGPDIMPFKDGDPRTSWLQCPCRLCRQLFKGRLWKCSPIAYLQLQKERYPELSPDWDPYLAYQSLGPECTNVQLDAFLTREEEPICRMCPAQPQAFNKPSPLIPLGHIIRQRAK